MRHFVKGERLSQLHEYLPILTREIEAPPNMDKKENSCSVTEDAVIIHYTITCHNVAMNRIRPATVSTLYFIRVYFIWAYCTEQLVSLEN